MPYVERQGYLLNDVPAPHMRHIAKRARSRNTSLTNVAGQLLAERYSLVFEESTRRNKNGATGDTLALRLPVEVMEAVRAEADERSVTIRTVMLDALSDSFGLKRPKPTHVDPARRPGRPKER